MRVIVVCEFSGIVRDAFNLGIAGAMAFQWGNLTNKKICYSLR